MDNLDTKLYETLAECAAANLPIKFCGDDATRKWELLALLKAYLKKSGGA